MPLPLIQPPSHSKVSMIGEVIIHEGAVVAPGTILQAAPNCRIVIHEGACIGMGTLINAYQGDIEIKSGAMLGAGVLIVGQGTIGQNVCLGSCTTVINTSVEAGTTIEAGALIGDTSRTTNKLQQEITAENNVSSNNSNNSNGVVVDNNSEDSPPNQSEDKKPEFVEEMEDLWADSEPKIEEVTEIPELPEIPNPSPNNNAPVVGQVYINQLLCTLFPDGQTFNKSQKNSSLNDSSNNNKT